jgi:tetratricopeptide (TPR) repeat protein
VVEPNLLLETLLERAGLSHAGLAKRVNTAGGALRLRYDHASVARWIRDHAVPRSPVPELICQVLAARLGETLTPADLGMHRGKAERGQPSLARFVDRATALWRGDQRGRVPTRPVGGAEAIEPVWDWENPPDDRDLSHAGRRQVDQSDVARLRRARDRYQEMYRRVGGVPTRPRIIATLTNQAAPLLRDAYDDPTGRQLFRAAGGLAALAGVCAYDADQQALSQKHLFTALRMAKASADHGFGGYVVALLANQALHLGEHRHVIQYAQTALRAAGGRLGPALVADLHALAGKAYARMGDTAGCHEHLKLAEAAAARIDHQDEPAEVSYMTPGLVETQVAEALRRLGDLPAAYAYAEESVRTAPATHLRGQVHRHAGLALILTAHGEVEHSAHVAARMLDLAEGMESGRIRDRIGTVIDALRPHATARVVADLLDRADIDTIATAGA